MNPPSAAFSFSRICHNARMMTDLDIWLVKSKFHECKVRRKQVAPQSVALTVRMMVCVPFHSNLERSSSVLGSKQMRKERKSIAR